MQGELAESGTFMTVVHWLVRAIEVSGIAVIVVGGLAATAVFAAAALGRRDFGRAYRDYRGNLGRAILLGLEFLVAADIIGTVAVEPTLENLAVLAGIVLIRTFLSFALEVEINGHWPWREREARGVAATGGDEPAL